jgi:hypothetical protein
MRTKSTLTAAAVVGVCAAIAAPAGFAAAETAQETISRLQSEGYTVTIDKVGTAPLDQCTVTSVRNPQNVTQLVPYIGPGRGNNRTVLVPAIVSQTISVSLNCSR